MADKVRLGTAGNPPNFYNSPFKGETLAVPLWLGELGLSAYEVQMTHGIRMPIAQAKLLGERAPANDVWLSIHAPYYITLSSPDPRKAERSKKALLDTWKVAGWMGARTVVFHPGPSGPERKPALNRCIKNLEATLKLAREQGLPPIKLAPEVMGKRSLLGSLEEVIQISEGLEWVGPALDFGHLHARGGGVLNEKDDFRRVLILVEERLGREALENLHCHFSPVEYNGRGERVHRCFSDRVTVIEVGEGGFETVSVGFKPYFRPLAELISEMGLRPVIICESRNSQDVDALAMRRILAGLGCAV